MTTSSGNGSPVSDISKQIKRIAIRFPVNEDAQAHSLFIKWQPHATFVRLCGFNPGSLIVKSSGLERSILRFPGVSWLTLRAANVTPQPAYLRVEHVQCQSVGSQYPVRADPKDEMIWKSASNHPSTAQLSFQLCGLPRRPVHFDY